MASIRRTQSASYRSWHPPPPQQQQQLNKDQSCLSSSSSSSSASFVMSIWRLVFGALFPQRTLFSRRPSTSATWKRSFFIFLLFFVLGFFLGFSPFIDLHLDSITPRDLSFEIRSQEAVASVKQEESRDRAVVKQGSRVIENVGSRDVFKIKPVELEIKKEGVGEEEAKLLIVVTPTYNRVMQGYYLTRLGQTLRLVKPPLMWIVVEMGTASMETADLLRRTGVMYRHILCQKNSTNVKDRGVHQRNTALEHIESHRMDGIVYFADDDNIYSLELFENMRHIRRFGTLPVAMLAKAKSKAILEGPVCTGSQVIGWHANNKSKRLRRFHVDMSGFAFNSTILWDPKRWQRPNLDAIRQLDTVKGVFQETAFIEQLVEDESQMEAMPSGCSRIMTWHLHLDAGRFVYYPRGWRLSRNLETVILLK